MRSGRFIRVAAAALAVTGVGGAGVAAAELGARTSSVSLISGAGIGHVRLGASATALRRAHLIGPLRTGCPLGGPGSAAAALSRPLQGSVDFTLHAPRRVNDIDLTGGARTARRIGPGSTLAAVRSAYPGARISHATDAVFGLSIVKVGRPDGGPFELGISTRTHRVTNIGVPFIALCD